ncbi:hypothetical protein GOP47_0026404 [Adiantum capillus-veneris]|nr:hypothetical protein GOP47_0026404 [Adiantum capillus-veneris]
MGATARWLKGLIGIKKSRNSHGEQETLRSSISSKSKRWLGWKTGSSKAKRELQDKNKSLGCESTRYLHAEDFDQSRQHLESLKAQWAAIRIQCAFRRLLAKRALKALKAIVRIQAIIRGRLVRSQVARAHHLSIKALCYETTKRKEWCSHRGSVQEIEARRRHKSDGASRRERAMAYADLHQAIAKRTEFWQAWQRERHEFKVQAVQGMPEIAISYYYSGPILPSLATSTFPTMSSCAQEHYSKGEHNSECNREGTSPSISRPGYMDATISMRAKSKANLGAGNSLQQLTCQFPGYVYPVRRRHSSIAGLDTHHLLLHCRCELCTTNCSK